MRRIRGKPALTMFEGFECRLDMNEPPNNRVNPPPCWLLLEERGKTDAPWLALEPRNKPAATGLSSAGVPHTGLREGQAQIFCGVW